MNDSISSENELKKTPMNKENEAKEIKIALDSLAAKLDRLLEKYVPKDEAAAAAGIKQFRERQQIIELYRELNLAKNQKQNNTVESLKSIAIACVAAQSAFIVLLVWQLAIHAPNQSLQSALYVLLVAGYAVASAPILTVAAILVYRLTKAADEGPTANNVGWLWNEPNKTPDK